MIINEEKQEITLSFKELNELVTQGFIQARFLEAIEKHLKNEAPQLSNDERIRKTDELLESSEYVGVSFAEQLEKLSYSKAIFDYLELSPKQAIQDLQAACYPALVAFHEAYWGNDKGEVWRTPYIISLDAKHLKSGKSKDWERMVNVSYLTNKGTVSSTWGDILEIKSKSSISQEDWLKYARKTKEKLTKKSNYPILLHTIKNPKTGEEFFAITRQLSSESMMARRAGENLNTSWYKARKGKDGEFKNLPEAQKQEIIARGREAIESLHEDLFELASSGLESR